MLCSPYKVYQKYIYIIWLNTTLSSISSPSRWSSHSSGSVRISLFVLCLWRVSLTHHVPSLWALTLDTLTSMIPHPMWSVWTWTPTLYTCEHPQSRRFNIWEFTAMCFFFKASLIVSAIATAFFHICNVFIVGLMKKDTVTGRISQRSPARVLSTLLETCTSSLPLVRSSFTFITSLFTENIALCSFSQISENSFQ